MVSRSGKFRDFRLKYRVIIGNYGKKGIAELPSSEIPEVR